jgi:signal transduction histidine kinase
MTNLGPAALLARLTDAAARMRGAARPDDVLDVAAEEARSLTGAEHAWAACLDAGVAGSLRSSSGGGRAATDPAAQTIAALIAAARPFAHAEGLAAVALFGASAAPEGVLVVGHASGTDASHDAAVDLALGQLAVIVGPALEAARLRHRLENVTRARELLLGSVSHDLRNPLNTFAMSAGLLRDDAERNDIDATRAIALISRMERATSRMQVLIDDLVEASRIDARKVDYAVRDESAADILKAAVTAAKPAAGEKGVQVTLDAVDESVRVTADRARTLQLIAKVITFEAKCTGDSGNIRLGVSRTGDAVVFNARAFGPGGVPAPVPEAGRGGLALLLARGLAEGQRGTFRIDAGDTLAVTFTLPLAKA